MKTLKAFGGYTLACNLCFCVGRISSGYGWRLLTLVTVFQLLGLQAQNVRLLSSVDPGQIPATGSGDSGAPIISVDGRHVVFASTARNLVQWSNDLPRFNTFPEVLNVFMRDRVSGATTLVSVNTSGTGGANGNSTPIQISTNNQYVLFESSASDLVRGDTNNANDIFVRDLVNGVTILASASTNGAPGKGAAHSAVMTPDGRYVAFVSLAANLVPGDFNEASDVFVRDLQARTSQPVSARPNSSGYLRGSEAPQISDDGRYVAYQSNAVGLASGSPFQSEIYVRDLVNHTNIWASAFARTATATSTPLCFNHALSGDGRFVAYEAAAGSALYGMILRYDLETGQTDVVHTNAAVLTGGNYEEVHTLDMSPDGRFITFVANAYDTSGTNTCIQLWDAQSGECVLVSADQNGLPPVDSLCELPSVDLQGRYVAFLSTAEGLVTNTTFAGEHLYFHDVQIGSTILVDTDTNGIGAGVTLSSPPFLSSGGRLAAFESAADHLVSGDQNRARDVFLRDLDTGDTAVISARAPALPTATPNGSTRISSNSLSADGRYVVFTSEAENLVPGDTNGWPDVFVRDLATGSNFLVSLGLDGGGADGASFDPAISPDGRFVAFVSSADNLASGDTNRTADVFLRDLQTGSAVLVDFNAAGTAPARSGAYAPIVSVGGRYVLFRSKSSDLVGIVRYPGENLFLRDMQTRSNYLLTTTGLASSLLPSMTPDGKYVAFAAFQGSSSLNPQFAYVWDSQRAVSVYTNTETSASITGLALSRDGGQIAYCVSPSVSSATTFLYLASVTTTEKWALDSAVSTNWQSLLISGDGRWLVGTKTRLNASSPKQVWLYELPSGAKTLVSAAYNSGLPGKGVSDFPAISSDGRFVAFRSSETNILSGDINGQSDLFLYDRISGSNALLSATAEGAFPQFRSLMPVFSADGSTLVFQSWASDLAPRDFNHASDVWARSFVTAVLLPGGAPGEGPWIAWPSVFGLNARVQYKDAIDDPAWQELGGVVTNLENRVLIQDPTPNPFHRFYRVVNF